MIKKITLPDYISLMRFRPLETTFVALLGHYHENRHMLQSEFNTRCIQQGEIHELIYLKENEDGFVDFANAWYLGFIEFQKGGVLAKGMDIEIAGQRSGKLAGFDITHTPNHYNILISSKHPKTGPELGIELGDGCQFTMKT